MLTSCRLICKRFRNVFDVVTGNGTGKLDSAAKGYKIGLPLKLPPPSQADEIPKYVWDVLTETGFPCHRGKYVPERTNFCGHDGVRIIRLARLRRVPFGAGRRARALFISAVSASPSPRSMSITRRRLRRRTHVYRRRRY